MTAIGGATWPMVIPPIGRLRSYFDRRGASDPDFGSIALGAMGGLF
jgi:hypothetical protein